MSLLLLLLSSLMFLVFFACIIIVGNCQIRLGAPIHVDAHALESGNAGSSDLLQVINCYMLLYYFQKFANWHQDALMKKQCVTIPITKYKICITY